jgi:hypothetical protein
VVTAEEEIARKEAEEILRKAEERQKLIDIRAAEVCSVANAKVFKKSYLFVEMYLNRILSILVLALHRHL